MALKYYKGLDDCGKDFYSAMCKGWERSGHDPPLIETWIRDQEALYLEIDYDDDRFKILIEDMDCERINDILKFEKIEYLDRDILDKLIVKYANTTRGLIKLKELKTLFLEDLKHKRFYWASERASDDFQCRSPHHEKGTDEDWAQFLGVELEVVGFESWNGERIEISEAICCPSCCEYCYLSEVEKEVVFQSSRGREVVEGKHFCCPNCAEDYEFASETFKSDNKHLDPELLVRLVL
jgi:hypothetical protein